MYSFIQCYAFNSIGNFLGVIYIVVIKVFRQIFLKLFQNVLLGFVVFYRTEQIQVDSLSYLSLDGMLNSVMENNPTDFCAACFNREYPVEPKFGNGKGRRLD